MRALAFLAALIWLVGLAAPAFAAGGGGHGGGSQQGSGSRITTSPAYVEFAGLATAVVDRARAAGMIQVEWGLEIPDARQRELAIHLMPLVRAECAEALRTYVGDMYTFGTPPDAEEIAAMMQERVDGALGAAGAQVVLSMVIYHAPR